MKTATALRNISERLGIPEDTLVRESLVSFLRERRRALMAERFEILDRYGVHSAEELRSRIESGILPEHPTWEDYIELVNLEDGLNFLEGQLCEFQPHGLPVFP